MKSLKEILTEQERYSLTKFQKGMLASIYITPTEELAYDLFQSSRNSVESGEQLQRLGYVDINDNSLELVLTDKGQQALEYENLVDESGELTERGEALIKDFNESNTSWELIEGFSSPQ